MNINIETNRYNIKNDIIKNQIKELLNLYLEESLKGNKVAFFYENINDGSVISFNRDICFYAASTIKILVCIIVLEKVENNELNLADKILVTMSDLKQDTGIIKYQTKDTYYELGRLVELTITESDNTAYLKLVNLIGKDKIASYGRKLGAEHTMEGKSTDSFGIINCNDMIIYWKKVREYIESKSKYSQQFKEYLLNPTIKLIKDINVDDKPFIRKYGSWDIAYHECGYVESDNPYYLIILTQLNKTDYKKTFINETARMITTIHKLITKKESD